MPLIDKAKRYTDITELTPELLRLFIEKIFKVQSLNAQLGHLGIQLLRLRHFRQARDLGA